MLMPINRVRTPSPCRRAILLLVAAMPLLFALPRPAAADESLLNVSYDPTRELWKSVNETFIPAYKQQSGESLQIKQSHGGSGSQARAVIDGLEADVVTLAMWPDTDAIRKAGLISDGWEKRFPNNSIPYTSTIVFVVRKGNPKGIKDWPDIVKPGVEIVTPNPKTSGNGKLSFLAAWGSVTQRGGSEEQAKEFVTKLYKQAPVLDTGRARLDHHLRPEGHRRRAADLGERGPSASSRSSPARSRSSTRRSASRPSRRWPWSTSTPAGTGTTKAADAYLDFLYHASWTGDHRPELLPARSTRSVAQKYASTFPNIKLFTVDAVAKDWPDAYDRFFGDGKIYDTIYTQGK